MIAAIGWAKVLVALTVLGYVAFIFRRAFKG